MVTIKEVAQLAGVSVATVSRTLSRPDKVAESTREKVLEAVQRSGYVTNVLASNFRRRRSQSVVVLVPDIGNAFYSPIIQEIEAVARRHGYQILLGETQQRQAMEQSYGDFARRRLADGIITLGMHIPFEYDARRKTVDPDWPPLVMACEYAGQIPVPTVAIDNRRAAMDATQHLLQLGHSNIAFIGGPADFTLSVDRLAGFKGALAEAGIKSGRGHVLAGEFTPDSGYRAARRLLGSKRRPTALFCASDSLAIGALSAAYQLGVRVPDDLSVVGFDDIDIAAYCNPPLTTVHQPRAEIGRRAAELMLQLLGGEQPPESRILLRHELVVRGSTRGL